MRHVPTFNLIYNKALIDRAFVKFFDAYNDSFQKINDKYVLSKSITRAKLQKIFESCILDDLKTFVKPYNILEPNYYLVLGACMPIDNILLSMKNNDQYFPEKLNKLISGKFQIKYVLKEKDIQIDIVKFNAAIEDAFDRMFKSDMIIKKLGLDYKNVIFIKHQNLDCYSLFKTIKFIYGKSNCWNIHKEKFSHDKSPIIAINDLIDKYIHNKQLLNKNSEFSKIVSEITDFLTERLKEINNVRS